jgi:threonine dehydratase
VSAHSRQPDGMSDIALPLPVHSLGNEPALIAGVVTYTLEILETRPDTEVIVVPVGGGAAGACVAAKAVRPSIEVIGVQSEAAPRRTCSRQAVTDHPLRTPPCHDLSGKNNSKPLKDN